MLTAVVAKAKPVSSPSFIPYKKLSSNLIMCTTKESPKQTIKMSMKVEAIIWPIPFFRSGLLISSLTSAAHLVPKSAFEYQRAPRIKYAIAATKIAHQLRCEKIAVFITVSFGLNLKAINNKWVFKNCF